VSDAPPPPDPDGLPPEKNTLGKFRDRFFGLGPARPDDDTPARPLSDHARLATAGLELAGGILIFTALGWGLDSLIHTFPAFLIVGAVLGLAGGMYRLVKAVQPPSR